MWIDPRRRATVVVAFGIALMTTALFDSRSSQIASFALAFLALFLLGGGLLSRTHREPFLMGFLLFGVAWSLLLS